jgi:S-adenosylmethionine:tRNA ribosyltransferase-isomerase
MQKDRSFAETAIMKTADFDYKLTPELIAQFPCEERDGCRLLCLDRKSGEVSHRTFKELSGLLSPGDLLVFNNTKVIPARLFCIKKTGGKVELLLTGPSSGNSWNALVRPGTGCKAGEMLRLIKNESVVIKITAVNPDGTREVSLISDDGQKSLIDIIKNFGVMALPHYIRRPAVSQDSVTYQTVYARQEGAIASPTAGLHFTHELMDALAERGIGISYVTLHVGIGTFKPVTAEDPRDHIMHEEAYELTKEAAAQIARTKERGGRVIAVGTTSVRVIEHCAKDGGPIQASSGKTALIILPGYEFRVIDGMITNFHVPKSTLLMLVSAFAGREAVLAAYRNAVENGYRFFSYGDAMLIL